MTAYTKSTNFATKDTLTSGDPLKIVKGTEINTEFDNIATAVNSKSDTASPTFTGTVTIPILSVTGASTLTGVATLTAQPILSSLTASSAVATDASKGLVSVTNTGTGNNVLATSPTLVTPILGTPASGTVTNLTGTASININGTVGATTANTGAFTTLSATGVTTVQAGTAALPAITTTGDTNTGIFFPAADTIAFSEGGVEAMRIDSGGNLAIGTTTNNTLDAVGEARPLVVQKSDTSTTLNGSTAAITIANGSATTNNTAQLNFAAITGASGNQYSSGIISCIFGARTNTQYPTGTLTFSTSTSLNTAPSEKMRLANDGSLLVGSTANIGANAKIFAVGSGQGIAVGYGTGSSAYRHLYMNNADATLYFFNDTNYASLSGAGAWTNASDARLKKNIVDIKYGLADVLRLQPRSYQMNSVEGDFVGFVAQELQGVIPEVVSGDPEKQLGVDYGSLVAVAFKAIQEQQALITALTTRITALENQ